MMFTMWYCEVVHCHLLIKAREQYFTLIFAITAQKMKIIWRTWCIAQPSGYYMINKIQHGLHRLWCRTLPAYRSKNFATLEDHRCKLPTLKLDNYVLCTEIYRINSYFLFLPAYNLDQKGRSLMIKKANAWGESKEKYMQIWLKQYVYKCNIILTLKTYWWCMVFSKYEFWPC